MIVSEPTPSASTAGAPGLRLDGIEISVGGRSLLSLTANVGAGDMLTVMGPSGSGKSSLLGYIAGTLAPAFQAMGTVVLNGRSLIGLPPEQRRVGMLFQDDLLFPHLSIGGNLAFALPRDLRGRTARRQVCEAALANAGLEGFYDRDPATLSGGQRARVAVLRVLQSKPEALLLDEPFSKLDATLRQTFRTFVFNEARRHAYRPSWSLTTPPTPAPPVERSSSWRKQSSLIVTETAGRSRS